MVAPNFWIAVTVGRQSFIVNGVIRVIPEFRIAMMIGSQSMTIISRLEKEYGMVDLMTITIPGAVSKTITIL